jgi:predicted glutamine amidotransferase
MCGIIFAKNLKDSQPVNQTIKALYIAQKDRGYNGFGFVGLSKNSIGYYRSETEKDIYDFLTANPFDEILYHHRYPTSTENTTKTAHPFKIDYNGKTFYFVHNGVINNASTLKKEHDKLALEYTSLDHKKGTFNDSEALAHCFVLALNKKKLPTNANGSASIICLQVDSKTSKAERLYYYTNGENPLKLYKDSDLFILSSETGTENVKPNKLYYYDYRTKQIKKQPTSFKVEKPSYTYYGYSGGYTSDYFNRDYRYNYQPKLDSVPLSYDELMNQLDTVELELLAKEQEIQEIAVKHPNSKKISEIEEQLFELEDEKESIQELLAKLQG